MIKSLNKDDITSTPFVVSKRWRATSKSNPNLLMADVDFSYYFNSQFVSESNLTSFVSESNADIPFVTENEFRGPPASSSVKPLSLEFIDYGVGWQFGCTSSLISDSNSSIILENTSSGEINIEVEGSTDHWILESYSELSNSKVPYNGPAYRFNLPSSVPFTNSICNLCLEQSEDNFLTIEDGFKIDQSVIFNPTIEQKNINGTYKRIIYDQIKNLFYNESKDPTKLLGLENLDTFLDGKNRVLYDKVKVVTVPQAYFGDKIVENSVEIIENSSDQTYTVVDDGQGNLYVKENVFGVIVSDQNKDIKYFNRDFQGLRNLLVDYTKTYFPNTYNDFSPSSPGMMFMEMAAYVGDVLSFYLDNQVQENYLQFARQSNNLFELAYMFGYKPNVTGVATTSIDFYQKVPSILSGSTYVPDFNYSLFIPNNFTVSTTVSNQTSPVVSFLVADAVDFSVSNSFPQYSQ